MDRTVLVAEDVRLASALMSRLMQYPGMPLAVLMTALFEQYSDPRVVLASPAFDKHDSHFNYVWFGEILRSVGSTAEPASPLFVRMDEAFTQELMQRYRPLDEPDGLKIKGVRLGDRYVELGYLYLVR